MTSSAPKERTSSALAGPVTSAMMRPAPAARSRRMAESPMGPAPLTTTSSPRRKRERRMAWNATHTTSKSTASFGSVPSATGMSIVCAASWMSIYSA